MSLPTQQSDRGPTRPDFGGRSAAIVHEWVSARAGSEKVFERLAGLLPMADLFALTVEPDVALATTDRGIQTTFLDRPFLRRRKALTLPLMPLAWRAAARHHNYDFVLSSTHAFAREFVDARQVGLHLCYVHSPMRYAWERSTDPRTSNPFAALPAAVLRAVDKRSVENVESFAVNSVETRDRVRRHYRRDARVIHPPVDTSFFARCTRQPSGYLLSYGRFIEYKRFDLAIAAAERVGMPLVLAGSGPLEPTLRTLAAQSTMPVTVVISPSDEELLDLLGGAELLIFPGVEDFGIVPVEALAAGVPVVGPAAGGLLDSVVSGSTGVLVPDQTTESLSHGIRAAIAEGLGGSECRKQAALFSPDRFDRQITDWIESHLNQELGSLGQVQDWR